MTALEETSKWDVSEVKTDTFIYNWTIKQFSYLRMQSGEKLISPVFSFGGSKNKIKWHLSLYPNGEEKKDKGFLSLYLCWKHVNILKGQYKLSLINYKKEKQEELESNLEDKSIDAEGVGFPKFIKRDELLDKGSCLLPDDSLTIQCEIHLCLNDVKLISEKRKQKLQVDADSPQVKKQKLQVSSSGSSYLEKLFLDEHLSDIKLIVSSCGKSLPAHKNVLAACSPVFKAMFSHEMQEQRLGEVKIDDGNYEVIKQMLQFVYTRKVENLETIASELLKLAHKYQITDLVEVCVQMLKGQISTDNVLTAIDIADRYNIEHLKTSAIKFGITNLKEIIKSEDFKSSTCPCALKSVLEAFSLQ